MQTKPLLIGVDVGGTFTDVIAATGHGVRVQKVLSTPPGFQEGIVDGLRRLIDDLGRSPGDVAEIVHATTAATNAILERRGARTALVTTRGFRDVLEIGRLRVPVLYDPMWDKPTPLVPRRLRLEVDERIDAAGNVIAPLVDAELDRIAEALRDLAPEAIAVCLLNSYVNPAHERMLAARLARAMPEVHVSTSEGVLPLIKEFERTSTTVVNAYVAPLLERYLGAFRSSIARAGFGASIFVMQSNGGMLPIGDAISSPVFSIESGPAAGVIAALDLATRLDIPDAIAFDMGGTTAKASLIENGEVSRSPEYEVGGAVSISSRLVKGGGYLIGVPAIDIAEVGTGGGGVIAVDHMGVPHVGPRSAGAAPGPACYGLGGREPTVTDANLVLGYLGTALAGGTLRLDASLAEQVIRDSVALKLGCTVTEAAYGAHHLANAGMMRAARAVSIERGRDPRKSVLIAFGGSGPVHATGVAERLRMRRVVVPEHPGVFSARGLLSAHLEFHAFRSLGRLATSRDWLVFERTFNELESTLRSRASELHQMGLSFHRFADLRYLGQGTSLSIAVTNRTTEVASLVDDFARAHETEYGYRLDDTVEVESLRVVARKAREPVTLTDAEFPKGSLSGARGSRKVYFGPTLGWIDTPVLTRTDVPPELTRGPAVVEDYDATTLVPPYWNYRVDCESNLHLEIEPGVGT
jgi:N-methylhydantoinase A